MKDNRKTLVFAVGLGALCSLLLAATSSFTAPYREANEKAEKMKNFLQALEVPIGDEATARELLDVYNRNVRSNALGSLTVYAYQPEGEAQPRTVAVPFSGPGLWAEIKGVLALAPDMIRIKGIRFYKQEETPGLGGEISSERFLSRFAGKQIVDADGNPGFRITKPGEADGPNEVDGITAATMTSERVQTMLDQLAKQIGEERASHGE